MSKYYIETYSSILHSELVPLINDVACFKLQRDRKNITDQRLSMEHTPMLQIQWKVMFESSSL